MGPKSNYSLLFVIFYSMFEDVLAENICFIKIYCFIQQHGLEVGLEVTTLHAIKII